MKSFGRILILVILFIAAVILSVNLYLLRILGSASGRPYRVEINRIALQIEDSGLEQLDLTGCEYVTNIEKYSGDKEFYQSPSDYSIREINGELYRFDYTAVSKADNGCIAAVNIGLGSLAFLTMAVLLFCRWKILLPFARLTEIPYELSKGNLVVPLKESKSRFFGRFVWGVNLLRENLEQQKQREMDLQRDKKTLLLSLTHDIKTPLSAIKLYAKALSKRLYSDEEKLVEIAESINAKADEIGDFISQIVRASKEEFIRLDVDMDEFYLSELMNAISDYYREKLQLIGTDFSIGAYLDCLLKGDKDRSIETLQNIMENAVKYGDGRRIAIGVSEEDGCILISIYNSGCTLPEEELPHIFESFWRGSNSEKQQGSGLGLYISRQLMCRMGGEIFAQIKAGEMIVTAVFGKV